MEKEIKDGVRIATFHRKNLPYTLQSLYFPHVLPSPTVGSAAPDTARVHPKEKRFFI